MCNRERPVAIKVRSCKINHAFRMRISRLNSALIFEQVVERDSNNVRKWADSNE